MVYTIYIHRVNGMEYIVYDIWYLVPSIWEVPNIRAKALAPNSRALIQGPPTIKDPLP